MADEGNREILLRAMARFDAGDPDGYLELYDPAIRLGNPADRAGILQQRLGAVEMPGLS